LEAQQHKNYAQTTPLDDGVYPLLSFEIDGNYRYSVFPTTFMVSPTKKYKNVKNNVANEG
jgi:hypothetical protein